MLMGGPAIDLLLGFIVLFILLPRAKKWGIQLPCMILAYTTLIAFWGYWCIGCFFGYGDFANVARSLDINQTLMGAVGLIGLIVFVYLIIRIFLSYLSSYFLFNSWQNTSNRNKDLMLSIKAFSCFWITSGSTILMLNPPWQISYQLLVGV